MPSLETEWRAEDLSVPPSNKYAVGHCSTNNLSHDEPKARVDAIIKVSEVFQEKLAADVNVILTDLLPRDLNKFKQRNDILKENSDLKKSSKDETYIYCLEQDRN